MSKLDKNTALRMEGMAQALRIAEAKGVDGLRSEIQRRGISKLPLSVSNAEMNEWCDKVKYNTFKNCWILMMVTLRDELGFGTERLTKVMKRFWTKADCIDGDYTTWDDQVMILAEEVGIHIDEKDEDLTMKIGGKGF